MDSPAFQLYIQDFLTGTMHMSAEEIGAYMLLLCHQWDKGALPDDDKALSRLGRISVRKLSLVKEKFEKCEDNMLRNNRLERERMKQKEWREKSSLAGKKSAEVKRARSQAAQRELKLTSGPDVKPEARKTMIGEEGYDQSPSMLMWQRFECAISELMINTFWSLRLEDIFAEIERQYPSGTIFTNDRHVLNTFKATANRMLDKKRRNAERTDPAKVSASSRLPIVNI